MLCAVVKFGACNELTTFITLTQVYSVQRFGFETAVVDALQDDSLSANSPCRSPFGASTRLQARGYV